MVHALRSTRYLHPPLLQHHCWPIPLMLDVPGEYISHVYPDFCRVFTHDRNPASEASMGCSRLGFGVPFSLTDP